jgi:hypothetical protein
VPVKVPWPEVPPESMLLAAEALSFAAAAE